MRRQKGAGLKVPISLNCDGYAAPSVLARTNLARLSRRLVEMQSQTRTIIAEFRGRLQLDGGRVAQ